MEKYDKKNNNLRHGWLLVFWWRKSRTNITVGYWCFDEGNRGQI